VLTGLRIIIDLFVNLDEFTEHADLETAVVLKNIFTFYLLNSTLYFRDFAGMITVVAAAFSFGKMVRHNELVAVMASGVSLKRIIFPIMFLALLLTALLVIDQELIIPSLAEKLVRGQGDIPGHETYQVKFIRDGKGSHINSLKFDVETSTLYDPTILLRRRIKSGIWEVTGRVDADKAIDSDNTGQWVFYTRSDETGQWLSHGWLFEKGSGKGLQPVPFYKSDIRARDIPVRCESEHKTLLSLRQLRTLEAQKIQITDMAQLSSQKHFHITDPLINLVMLMISLPILVCRDPKSVKSAVMISFALTGACFIFTFVCKITATEVIFDRVMPELWAWLPVFIFLPIAFIELDSMKT
jgi:lipopolysaccharide export system permease protein